MVQSFTVQGHIPFNPYPMNQGIIQPDWESAKGSESNLPKAGQPEGGV